MTRAVQAETGRKPVASTSGGTSDARFIKDHCPVIEFGLVGKTMHQVDEGAHDGNFAEGNLWPHPAGVFRVSLSETVKIEVTGDIPTCQALRRVVFIDEQGVSEADEVDGLDGRAIHLLAWDGDCPVGTARLLVKGAVNPRSAGSVCCRKCGGWALARHRSAQHWRCCGVSRGVTGAYLGAQSHATGFYEKLGFVIEGEEFLDAGIPAATCAAPCDRRFSGGAPAAGSLSRRRACASSSGEDEYL